MKKTFKKIAASVMAMATLAVGVAGMSVSADQIVGNYGTFTWSERSLSVTNTTRISRKVITSVTVYSNSTGAYITTAVDSKTCGYGTTATVTVSSAYPSSLYNFRFYGAIYNSTVDASGVAESWSNVD